MAGKWHQASLTSGRCNLSCLPSSMGELWNPPNNLTLQELWHEPQYAAKWHILLVDHKNAQLWLPPGGHVDVSLWYVVNAAKNHWIRYDDDEFNGVRWFQYSDVPLRSDPHLTRFLAKMISGV